MVNKREKTRSLVYQLKEEIFHREASLAELEIEESTIENFPEDMTVPLPKFCHHSTGTVYDHPEDILRMAHLFEERGQRLDRKSMSPQKNVTPRHPKTRVGSDVSPTISRHNRQNTRPCQADVGGFGSSPVTSRSPIQQLFRDKMEGLESVGWAASSLEVKTDSASDEPVEMNNKHSVILPVDVDNLDEPTISSAASLMSVTNCNTLDAANNQKYTSPRPNDSNRVENISVGIDEMPLTESAEAFLPAVTAPADLHNVTTVDIPKTDQAPDVLVAVNRHSDKRLTSRENENVKTEKAHSENRKTSKVKAALLESRSAGRKSRDSAKKVVSEVVNNDDTTTSPVHTRRLVSTEQLNHVIDELASSLSPKSGAPRCARKTRSNEHLRNVDGSPSKQPTAVKSEVNLRRRSHPSKGKSRENEKVLMQDALKSQSDACLRPESSKDEKHMEAMEREQKVPLHDSSTFNQTSLTESTQQVESKNLEATNSTSAISRVSTDFETTSAPYFHADNFSLIESDSSKSSNIINRSAADLSSVKLEVNSRRRGSLLTKRPNNEKTRESKRISAHGALGSKSDTGLQLESAVKCETIHSPGLVTPKQPATDAGSLLTDILAINSVSSGELKAINSSKSKGSGLSLENEHGSLLMPEILVSRPEIVEKRTSSASRSRPKSHPIIHGTDVVQKLDNDSQKNMAKEDGEKKKYAGLSRKKTNMISTELVSAREKCEAYAVYQTDDGASLDRKSSLAFDDQEVAAFDISRNKSETTELPFSVSSETSVASAAANKHTELTGCDVFSMNDSVFSNTNDGMLDMANVDNPKNSLASTMPDSLKSAGNLGLYSDHLNFGREGFSFTKAGFFNNSSTSSSSVKDVWKSGPNDVELKKPPMASSRKRAAHLMAGCCHRTVGVKTPRTTVEEELLDHELEDNVNDTYDQPSTSQNPSFFKTNSDFDRSAVERWTNPHHAPKHMPFVPTGSTITQSTETFLESPDRFFPPLHAADNSFKYVSQVNSFNAGNSSEVVGTRVLPQNLLVKDSLLHSDRRLLCERPKLMRHDYLGSGFSGTLLGSLETKALASPTFVTDSKDSRRQSVRAELLRKFLPSQLIVSDSVKRRVQEGLQLLASMRSAPAICSHTRQKLADYLNQSRKEVPCERLPLRSIEDMQDQSDAALRRRLPVRAHRQIYSESEYVSGEEFTSAITDADSNSDNEYSGSDFSDLAESKASVKSSQVVV